MSSIAILNPQPHGSRYASLKSAKRLIRKGRAVWADATKAAIRIIGLGQVTSGLVPIPVTAVGYDRVQRVMRRDELRALPFVGNVDRLDVLAPTARDWPWRVSTNRRTRKLVAS